MATNSPSGAIAIFVKTPGVSPIKTRLADSIGRKAAEEFYRLSVRAVEAVVRDECARRAGFQPARLREAGGTGGLETRPTGVAITPYWALAEPEGESHPLWGGLQRIGQGPGTLGERLGTVYDRLLARHDFVILLGADAPQVSPDGLADVAARLSGGRNAPRSPAFVLGPARDGGFYLFGGRVAVDRESWRRVSYSAADTAAQLAAELGPLGPVEELAMLTDADHVDDLPRVLAELRRSQELLAEQHAVAEWIAMRGADDAAPGCKR